MHYLLSVIVFVKGVFMRNLFAFFFYSMLTLGCSSLYARAVESLVLNKQEVEAAIKERLKDPDSAKFSGYMIGLTNDTGAQWGCVIVNAKNSFGGYTGNQTASLYRDSEATPWRVISIDSYPIEVCHRDYHKQASK